VFSDAAIESQLAGRGNPKAKSQGSAPSERQTLQSKTLYCTENRFLFNRLAVVHGRLLIHGNALPYLYEEQIERDAAELL
jgi:hypothetical protein